MRGRWASATLICLLLAQGSASTTATAPGSGRRDIAIIVHPENHAPDPGLRDLRAFLRLERQFWSDGRRIVILLPASGSLERRVLLERIYQMTDAELRRFWAQKLYAGEIVAIPLTLRRSDAAAADVQESRGALAVVPADRVPPGVRVLLIDGKRPGEPGYPLVLKEGQ